MDLENDNSDTDAEYVPDKTDLFEEKSRNTVSVAWKHFEKLENYTAECNYCQKQLSYKSSTSNLHKHLYRKHPDVLKPDDGEIVKIDTIAPDYKIVLSPNLSDVRRNEHTVIKKNSSRAWKHFVKLGNNTAQCNYCHNHLSYRAGVSNLHKHVQRKHTDVLITSYPDDSDTNASDCSSEENTVTNTLTVSGTWKHFLKLDNYVARCKHCHEQLSYKHSVSNLKKHIGQNHLDVIKKTVEILPAPDDDSNASVNASHDRSAENTVRTKTTVSVAWKHFDKLEKFIGQCRHCDARLSYKTSVSNLVKHIKRQHSHLFQTYEPEVREMPGTPDDNSNVSMNASNHSNGEDNTVKSTPNVSVAWKHFDKLDNFIGQCRHCQIHLSYKSSVSNLVKHIKRKHGEVLEPLYEPEIDDQLIKSLIETSLSNKSSGKQPSPVWDHFDRISEYVAKCKYCSKQLSFKSSISNLRKHLQYMHLKYERRAYPPPNADSNGNAECNPFRHYRPKEKDMEVERLEDFELDDDKYVTNIFDRNIGCVHGIANLQCY